MKKQQHDNRGVAVKYMGRIWIGLMVLSAGLLLTQSAQSEITPTSGTFKGFYHKYRDGQALFARFIVPEKFQAKFGPHDGKYIEVEVIKAASQWGRGRGGTIEELGKDNSKRKP